MGWRFGVQIAPLLVDIGLLHRLVQGVLTKGWSPAKVELGNLCGAKAICAQRLKSADTRVLQMNNISSIRLSSYLDSLVITLLDCLHRVKQTIDDLRPKAQKRRFMSSPNE